MNLTEEEVYALIAFIKRHERKDIPDEVWNICMKMIEDIDMW